MVFAKLSNELVELVFRHALDGPSYRSDRSTLEALSRVCSRFRDIARRLLFARIVVGTPDEGQLLLQTLARNRDLATCVRSLTIREGALTWMTKFSDISQDDLLRLCPNLVHFDSPVSSFNETADGRAPLPAWPANLRSLRFGRIPEFEFESEDDFSDMSEADRQLLSNTLRLQHAFESFPTTLRSLKISGVDHVASIWSGHSNSQHLKHLERLELDFVIVPFEVIDWLAGSCSLVELKIWMVTDPSSSSLEKIVKAQAGSLRNFHFKPVRRSQASFLIDVLPLLTNLERLTLGNHACDHTVWAKLPCSLTHLCVALPNSHVDARLKLVADTITKRLRNLQRLELYSHVYFPPPVEVVYPPCESGLAIREIRLSHIKTTTEDMSNFFLQLAPGLYTLALHHVRFRVQAPWPQFKSLRRLEYGKHTITENDEFFHLTQGNVHWVRMHIEAGGRLQTLLDVIERRSAHKLEPLRTVELVGNLDNVSGNWASGKLFDQLVSACAKEGTQLYMNGRTIATHGGLWTALQSPMLREEFV
ncbi:hypothetical protein JCM10296v2_006666 [Rhodotorula toruloides]